MNIEQLRHSVKAKWLAYYQQNRSWLVQLQVWGTDEGQRRPASSFILATVSSLEPELTELLPFMLSLSNDPDQIVFALGLNFDPDEELKLMPEQQLQLITQTQLHSMTETLAAPMTNGSFNRQTETTMAETTILDNDLSTQILPSEEDEVSLASSTQNSDRSSEIDESLHSTGKPNYAGLVLSILAVISSLTLVFVGLFQSLIGIHTEQHPTP